MGTGQMLLTVLATFLLTTVILTSNRSLLTNSETLIRAKQDLVSISLATSLLERASRLDFDTATINNTPTDPGNLGPIGIEGTEVAGRDSLFNDVDDYNNFLDTVLVGSVQDSVVRNDAYYLRANVCYVSEADPWGNPLAGTSATTKSWLKRIEVRIWPKGAKSVIDTFFLVQLQGYWKWR
jgi:hypothetical protein